MNSLVGREDATKDVAELLGTARLVTLTGMAGVGKSRLALAVAAAVAQCHAEAVWLVRLAPVADPALVPAAVAAVLGVREQPGRALAETLAGQLRHRRLLLVLDDCEHVIDATAALVATLLGACPGLRILVTSREPLAIGGEVTCAVPPLSVPPAEASAAEVTGHAAARLFVERAGAVEPGFALTEELAPAVGEICRRLDGLPLAIELAAARVRVLSPAQIAARLDDRFTLLTEGGRTAPSRHQSLHAAVEWSHESLSSSERVLLRRLSVFAGGCALEAAEQICTSDDLLLPDQIVDLLAGLVAKSLVVADTCGAQARYRLLETIRHYAADKLAESGEADALRAAHAACYTGLAEQAEPELTGARQAVWLERLEAEHGNLRVALEHRLTCGQPEQGLLLAVALSRFWWVRGHVSEGRDWLERALAASPGAPAALRARGLWATGGLAGLAGDVPAAVADAEQSLTLARQAGDRRISARALNLLGTYTRLHDPAMAPPLLAESVALARQAEDHWCLIASLATLGWAHVHQGDYPTARRLFEECLAVGQVAHDTHAWALSGLGCVALHEGDYESAEASCRQAVALAHQLGDTLWTGGVLGFPGELARVRGDYAQARSLLAEALALARESGYNQVIARVLEFQGKVAQAEADPAAARQLFEEGLDVVQAAGDKIEAAGLRVRLGEVCHALDDQGSAGALFEQAMADARHTGAKPVMAQALSGRGRLARAGNDCDQAVALHHQALRLQEEMGHTPGVIESLEALAGLAAHRGRGAHAARLFGAAQSLREVIGCVRPPAEQPDYDLDLAAAQRALFPDEFAAAYEQGRALSAREAVAYATKGRGPRQRPATGWASLTTAEREVARLAAQGLTNPEVGRRLFISRRTVQTHLAHIYAKLSISSRAQLPRNMDRRCG
ncbi:MAG: helix-turn-helix transcriptional regulator [Pseudonocardiaceae bacterium]